MVSQQMDRYSRIKGLLNITFQLRWKMADNLAYIGRGYLAGKRPSVLPAFRYSQRPAKDGFERLSTASFGTEVFALRDLLHRCRIAQDLKRFFKTLVFIIVHQDGRRFPVTGDDYLVLALLDPGDQLRQSRFHF